MKIILHAGTPKTGTTSIQSFARRNSELLRERGVWYPDYAEAGLGISAVAHHDFSYAIAGSPSRISRDDAVTFASYILDNCREDETILISAEPIYRLVNAEMYSVVATGAAGYLNSRKSFLRDLSLLFKGTDISFSLVLRRQESFARSLYQEHIKATVDSMEFRSFVHQKPFSFDYLMQVETAHQFFPKLRIFGFESLSSGPGLVENFFRLLLGVDFEISENPLERTSWPIELVELKRLINASGVTIEEARLISYKLGKSAEKVTTRGKSVSWESDDWFANFQESFFERNAQLASMFPEANLEELLSERRAGTSEVFTGFDARQLARVTAEVILATT